MRMKMMPINTKPPVEAVPAYTAAPPESGTNKKNAAASGATIRRTRAKCLNHHVRQVTSCSTQVLCRDGSDPPIEYHSNERKPGRSRLCAAEATGAPTGVVASRSTLTLPSTRSLISEIDHSKLVRATRPRPGRVSGRSGVCLVSNSAAGCAGSRTPGLRRTCPCRHPPPAMWPASGRLHR
jgi:hypothetical protein